MLPPKGYLAAVKNFRAARKICIYFYKVRTMLKVPWQ